VGSGGTKQKNDGKGVIVPLKSALPVGSLIKRGKKRAKKTLHKTVNSGIKARRTHVSKEKLNSEGKNWRESAKERGKISAKVLGESLRLRENRHCLKKDVIPKAQGST